MRYSDTIIREQLALQKNTLTPSTINTIKAYQNSQFVIQDPLKRYRESLVSDSDSIINFKNTITRIPNLLNQYNELTSAILKDEITDSPTNISPDPQLDIKVDSEGTISLAAKRITAIELQTLADTIFQKAAEENSGSLQVTINNISVQINTQKDPFIRTILTTFIYPLFLVLLSTAITLAADYYIAPQLNSEKRPITKKLKEVANSTIQDKVLLKSLRYVSADILNVRKDASIKSETIGHLPFTAAVLVIKKQKNWTLVEWNDPENESQITGWVHTRYIKKFR